MLRKIALSFFLLFLIAAPFMALPIHALNKSAQSIPAEQRQILVLKTYQYGLPIPDSIDRGIIAGLRESGGSVSNLFTEHLDLDRLPGSEYRAKVADLLRYKLAGSRIGIIIAEGFPAVDFLAREGKGLFPDAAVLTLITPSIGELSGGSRKVIDIPWRVDPAGTLSIAIDLFPNTRLVFVVTGSNDGVLPFLDEAKKAFAPWKGNLDFEYANEMAYDEMMQRISSLPPDSIIIYSPYFADVTGRTFVPAEVVAKISKSSPVPVFATLEPYLGRGIVGGALLKTEDIGRQVIKITLDYFTGKLQLIKPVTTFHTPIKMMFDWGELTRWNADTKRIPENSIVIARPLSLWSQYKNVVITAAIIFMAMILLIVGLMIMNNRLKLMTATARESEEQLNLVIKGSNDAPWDWDLISNEFYYSPQWWAQLGYKSDELPADAALWEKLMHPEDTDHVNSLFRGALNNGIGSYEVEFRLLHKKGHYVSVLSRGFITRDETGKPIRVTGTNMDLTERKQAEKELKEKSTFIDKVIESSAVSTWISDKEGTAIRTNPACLEFFGATEDEVIGQYNLFQDTVIERSGFMPDIREVFEKGRTANIVINYDFKAVDHVKVKNATHKTINSIFTPIKDASGKVSNVIVQTIDLTDIKRMENELMQSRKMESIGNLAGGIAHEFNNILSIIIGNNELVMEELPEWSLARENTEEIRIAGLRARDVVKQLLTFSRKDPVAKKNINIRSVVNESMKLIRSSIPANIEIQQNFSDDVSSVLGNATQINQLLINLCNNAVDAMPSTGGILSVDLSNETVNEKHIKRQPTLKPGRYVKLAINDNGFGMDKEILDKVFDPYFTTKEIGKGTGIGLAVVHGIVERHGGSIIADSHPGQGTTFTVFLPIHEGLLEDESDERTILPTGNERILYVDDEPSIAKLGKRHLESLGYTVESTTDPLQALEMVRSDPGKFELVISDMAMPHMTGDKLITEILKVRPDMLTIICTGYSAKISEKEAAKIGVHSFVMKPLDKAELAKTIRKVLDEAKGSA